jgi:hypothetical protein
LRLRELRTFSLALLGVASSAISMASSSNADNHELFVLGTLYKRHETVPAYDLAALKKTIVAIRPEVLVLDVSPSELAEQKVHPGKIEYPGVIFPLVRGGRYRVYAGEPAEPMFTEIVQALDGANRRLTQDTPENRATIQKYSDATYEALATIWVSPADVNNEVTERMLGGKQALESRLVGAVHRDSWARWNRHAVEVALRAVRENPGKRVLMITGIENCAGVRKHLRRQNSINLVDMEPWLRANVK